MGKEAYNITKYEYRNGYLRSEHWKQVRYKRLKYDKFRCRLCGSTENLNVHHTRYDNLRDEDIKHDVVTLCYTCHSMAHTIKNFSKAEYNAYVNFSGRRGRKRVRTELKKKIAGLLIKQINGRDIDVCSEETIKRMSKVVKYIYPDLKGFTIKKCLTDELSEMQTEKELSRHEESRQGLT